MMPNEVETLKVLLSMGTGELRSRANALPQLVAAANAVIPLLEGKGVSRVTSDEVASIAGRYMDIQPDQLRGKMAADIRAMAASLVSQSDGPDERQSALPLEEQVATRALSDAITTGQADPSVRTVAIRAPYGEHPDGTPKELKDLD